MSAAFPEYVRRSEVPVTVPAPTEQPQKGKLFYLDPKERLDPQKIPSKLFACLGSFKISQSSRTGESLNDVYFKNLKSDPKTRKELSAVLAERSPSIGVVFTQDCDPSQQGRDSTIWQPSVGNGYFSVSRQGGRYEYGNYNLFVYCPNETMSSDLHALATEMAHDENVTVENFLATPEFKEAKGLARRNLCKAADAIASVLGIELLEKEMDHKAPKLAGRTPPYIARPSSLTVFGTMTPARVTNSETKPVDKIVVADRMSSLLENVGKPLIQLGALSGIAQVESNKLPSSRFVSESDLESKAIPSGPSMIANTRHSDRDRAYVKDVCFTNKENAKALVSSRFDTEGLVVRVESAFDSAASRYEHVITYVN
jgi:hypothetical protein